MTDNNYITINTGDTTYISEADNYSHIDITVTDKNFATEVNWKTLPELHNSDNFSIILNIELVVPSKKKCKKWCLNTRLSTGRVWSCLQKSKTQL